MKSCAACSRQQTLKTICEASGSSTPVVLQLGIRLSLQPLSPLAWPSW